MKPQFCRLAIMRKRLLAVYMPFFNASLLRALALCEALRGFRRLLRGSASRSRKQASGTSASARMLAAYGLTRSSERAPLARVRGAGGCVDNLAHLPQYIDLFNILLYILWLRVHLPLTAYLLRDTSKRKRSRPRSAEG